MSPFLPALDVAAGGAADDDHRVVVIARRSSEFDRTAQCGLLSCAPLASALIDFFVYSRAAPGAADADDDPALDERHWTYMDEFADGMTARGPTLGADRATWTGSLHVVDLPSVEAAHRFVDREPYNRAGLLEHHLVLRFGNLLGCTMWDFAREPDEPRFLVIAQASITEEKCPPAAPRPDRATQADGRLIFYGELVTPDEGLPAGVALALQAPTREAVENLLWPEQRAIDARFDVQIHDWEFGGRR